MPFQCVSRQTLREDLINYAIDHSRSLNIFQSRDRKSDYSKSVKQVMTIFNWRNSWPYLRLCY